MYGENGGCGGSQTIRSGLGGGVLNTSPQNDVVEIVDVSIFNGLFGCFLDSNQSFKNYFGGITNQ